MAYPFSFSSVSKILLTLTLGVAWLIFSGLALAGNSPFVSSHHLFVDRHGKLWGWGGNDFGQLGRDDVSGARLPLPVEIAAPVVSAATGMRHSAALDNAGSVWAWGDNSAGQLGTGNFRQSVQPVRLDLPPVAAIAAGAWHTLALDKDGHVWAWGSNTLGQLGSGKSGKFSVSATPHKIAGLEKIRAIGGAGFTSFAVGADGKLWAWGRQPGSGAVWLLPRPSEDALPQQAVAAFDFSGRVTADGQPVNDAVVSVDAEVCGKTDSHGVYHCLLPAGFAGAVQVRKRGFDFASARIQPVSKKLANQIIRGHAKAAKPRQEVALRQEARQQRAAPIAANSVDSFEKVREKEATMPMVAAPQAAPKAQEDAPAQKREEPHPATIHIAGTVRMGSGQPVGGVEMEAKGAQCSRTDARGEYICSAPSGWSGRLVVVKRNYKFSPSAVSFKEVREDFRGQDLTAIYEPD